MQVRSGRWVLHLDMDAFFASAEQLTRPTLAGRPVLVGGLGPRAVVAGASYESRVFGVRSAMPMAQARRRCPHAVVVPPRFALYQALSERVMEVLAAAAPVLEPVSIDEAFLEPPDLAGADASEVTRFCTELRAAVREASGLPASIGAGSGKQVAKIASELAKPDGLRVVAPDVEREVLAPLPVRSLWGVGPVAETTLGKVGITTIGGLAATDLREVTGLLGTAVGTELHRLARGVDERPVAPRAAAKQVSAEHTFDTDLTDMAAVHTEVTRITASAHRRLLAAGRAARTVTVKMRGADFATTTRSETSAVASAELGALTSVAQRLAVAAVPAGGVRLIGVSLAGLGDDPPPSLFDPPGLATDAGTGSASDDDRAGPDEPAGHPADPLAPAAGDNRSRSGSGTGSLDGRSGSSSVDGHPTTNPGDNHSGTGPTGGNPTTSPVHGHPTTSAGDNRSGINPVHSNSTTGPGVDHPRTSPVDARSETDSGHGDPGTGGGGATADPQAGHGPAAGEPGRRWRPGDDVRHAEHGHGWVQGAGHGRVTVRFETRTSGPGRARTLADADPALTLADPLGSLT